MTRSFLLAVALTATACSVPVDGQAPAPTPSPDPISVPGWLVNTWSHAGNEWGWDTADEVDTYWYWLRADGTGELTKSVWFSGSDVDGYSRSDKLHWMADDSTLTIDSTENPLVASPNCRFLLLNGTIYRATDDVAGCPLGAPALSDAEAAIAGSWARTEKISGAGTNGRYTLDLLADRTLDFSDQPKVSWTGTIRTRTGHGYWTLDGDELTATLPDGTISYASTVTLLSDTQLRVCDDWGCNVFVRR